MSFFENGSTVRVVRLKDYLRMASGEHPDYIIKLPMIQRGFVWKPVQIIELWDSLLQGMPIGSLMVSENGGMRRSLPLPGGRRIEEDGYPKRVSAILDLVDGQQRTLAMLLGWMLFNAADVTHRLWIDFGDEPQSGHLLRLRITTRNHPYGFQRYNPNIRLSMDERRCARQAYMKYFDNNNPESSILLKIACPHPAGAKVSLPLDFSEVLNLWRRNSLEDWKSAILGKLKSLEMLNCQGIPHLEKIWPRLDDAAQHLIEKRIDDLSNGLKSLFKAEIPLLQINPTFFYVDEINAIEPPLARLFKRIGANATLLSNADYVYSILKYLIPGENENPGVHDMVERLHGRTNIAALLSATDLVMSALRLAASDWGSEDDNENPSKEVFHRLLWPKSGDGNQRQAALVQLLNTSGVQNLGSYFEVIQKTLCLQDHKRDQGLPRHFFPYLERPLVQVLLRLAQVGYINDAVHMNDAVRMDVLRLVLWWTQWVSNKPKASLIAFKEIKKLIETQSQCNLGKKIADAIVRDGAGRKMQPPKAIQELGLHYSSQIPPDGRLLGQSRFATSSEDSEKNRQIREFYRQWWRPWTYHHPMLLWLQRDYVSKLPGDPMAGMEDDTPYDFDHILPQAHWGGWSGVGVGERLLDMPCESGAYLIIGNAIGNVRVWNASDNRSDGDASPRNKMGQSDQDRREWMEMSAISDSELEIWLKCSPENEEQKKVWNLDRALAFQRAVETRTFNLYERLYQECGFSVWEISTEESK